MPAGSRRKLAVLRPLWRPAFHRLPKVPAATTSGRCPVLPELRLGDSPAKQLTADVPSGQLAAKLAYRLIGLTLEAPGEG
jgi:hypothetical protein